MDIVIVDDEPLARQRLLKLITELANDTMDYTVVAEASNTPEALEAIKQHDPAVVLLDIEMPGENGLKAAEKIAELDCPPAIIFTTAYDQYALDAFDTLAAGYLLKPIQQEKLSKALEKATAINKLQLETLEALKTKQQRDHISAKSHRGVELIPIDDVRYFMADQKYVMVISTQGQVLIDETLKELESEFAQQFIRIHRNALVSIKYISGLDRDQHGHYHVRLADIEETPMVSRRYSTKIKALLKSL
ncbi:MAG: LytR/AlgR family response regulator transcription factor [Cellvibrionaceae bacterium]